MNKKVEKNEHYFKSLGMCGLGWNHVIIIIAVVIAAVLLSSQYNPSPPQSDGFGFKKSYDLRNLSNSNVVSVQRSDLVPLNHLIADRVPKVVLNSTVMTWKALKWNLITLAESYPILHDVLLINKTKDNAVFVTQNEIDVGGMLSMVDESHVKVVTVVNELSFLEFISELLHSKLRSYFYSTNFRVIEGIAKLENDTSWRSLRINETDHEPPPPSLSILYPHSALQARYSEYHTMKVQIQGACIYTLISPTFSKKLHPYPSIHLSQKQSQINFYDQNNTVKNVHFMTKLVNPGDVIYIPPYWYVHIESRHQLSLTLDVLSVSKEHLLLQNIWHMQLPFNNDTITTKNGRIVSAQVYLMHLLSRLHGFESPKRFSKLLYKTRYSKLYVENGLFVQSSRNKFQCLRDTPSAHMDIVRKLDSNFIESTAQYAADLIQKNNFITPSIKWLFIGDYVEHIGRWAMGNPDETVLFIRECFQFDHKIDVVLEEPGPNVLVLNDFRQIN